MRARLSALIACTVENYFWGIVTIIVGDLICALGVDDDSSVAHDSSEHQPDPRNTIDACSMADDVHTISDDNANDGDSICESFYSGKWHVRKMRFDRILRMSTTSVERNMHTTFTECLIISYLCYIVMWFFHALKAHKQLSDEHFPKQTQRIENFSGHKQSVHTHAHTLQLSPNY